MNSVIYANYNYCPLVWHFCSKKFTKIQEISVSSLSQHFQETNGIQKIFADADMPEYTNNIVFQHEYHKMYHNDKNIILLTSIAFTYQNV